MQNLHHWSQTIRGARRVRDDFHVGRVLLVVDAIDKHGRVWARSSDDDLLGAIVNVRLALVEVVEDASRVDDVIDADGGPIELVNVSEKGLVL